MIDENKSRLDLFCENRYVLISIIALGILCRIAQYLLNPSLWGYEAIVALPILQRSFNELIEPLYKDAAPLGYLFLVKALTKIFGEGHYALRAFPLIASILAMPLFYLTAKIFLNGKALFFAIVAFAFSDELCKWAHTLRPYSSDVLMTVIIFAATAYFEKKSNTLRATLLAIVGALVVWFSYANIFVLAGVGAALFVTALVSRQKSMAMVMVVIGVVWLASFGISYKIHVEKVSSDPYFNELYSTKESRCFMPFPPKTLADLEWYVYTFWIMISAPLGSFVFIVKLVIIPLLAGAFYMWRENRKLLWMLLLPIIFSLSASAFHRYPYSVRHTLFWTPMMLILTGYGLGKVIEKAPAWASAILVCLIFIQPIAKTVKESSIEPVARENFRPVFYFVKSHYKEGQTLYVYGSVIYDFYYYSYLENWHPNYEEGKVDDIFPAQQLNETVENDLRRLEGKDVWAIFGEVPAPKYKEIIYANWVIKERLEVEGASCFNIMTK